jgi:hypothetical protein
MKIGHILAKYSEELKSRKDKPLFVWWERFGMLVFLLWLYDATIGFSDQKYVDLVYVLSWVLTGIALADLAWFIYKNRALEC